MQMMMMNAVANLVQTFAGRNSNAKASEPGLANLKVSPAKQKAIADGSVQATAASFKPKNRELCAGEKPEASNQAELPEVIGKDNGLSAKIAVDYEQELFDALKAKNEKKRAHDETTNGPAKVMKRPAGKPKATSKAKAKEKKEELDVPPLSQEDFALKRNVYVSRHYRKARAFARNSLGMTDEDAKTYARQFHQQAGLIWDAAKKKIGQ